MKKCSYCGRECPDEATACPVDQTPLAGSTGDIIMTTSDRNSYGGFWIRVAAYFVDVVILLIPTLLISFLLHSTIPAANASDMSLINLIDEGFNVLIWWVYTAAFLSSSWQATPGKRICGLKVVDYNGGRVSFGQATGRYFASILSYLLLCVGVLMVAWTARRQGLHDMIASTLVVKTTPPNNSPEPPPIDAVSPHSRLTDWATRLSFCR
jgi:uncharacterized RDD family membrane protein YckC